MRVAPPHWNRDKTTNIRTGKVVTPRNLLARRTPVPNGTGVTYRNAIGTANIRRDVPLQRHDARGNLPGIAHVPGGATSANAPTGLPGAMDRRFAEPHWQTAAPVRGAISGTGMTHHAIAPAVIGGPARVAGGISGTTIRPKH